MFKAGNVPWNKGLAGYTGGLVFYPKGHLPWNKGLTKGSDPRMQQAAERMAEAHKNNREIRGDLSGVGGKHDRIRHRFGKNRMCSSCGTTDAKFYDWANLDHKYNSENTAMWCRLCRKCHARYDMGLSAIQGKTLAERGGVPKRTVDNLVRALPGEANLSKLPNIRAKISASLTGKKMSQAHRDSLQAWWHKLKGNSNPAKRPEVRAKIAAAKRGYPRRGGKSTHSSATVTS